jgi:hypothetical protein
MEERTKKMMDIGHLQTFARYQAAKKRFPGARGYSFRSTARGWQVTPHYGGSGKSEPRWKAQHRRLEQQLLTSQLEAIRRTF